MRGCWKRKQDHKLTDLALRLLRPCGCLSGRLVGRLSGRQHRRLQFRLLADQLGEFRCGQGLSRQPRGQVSSFWWQKKNNCVLDKSCWRSPHEYTNSMKRCGRWVPGTEKAAGGIRASSQREGLSPLFSSLRIGVVKVLSGKLVTSECGRSCGGGVGVATAMGTSGTG